MRHKLASMAQSNVHPTGDQVVRQHSFVEIDHGMFSTVILPLPLQEGEFSVSGKRIHKYCLTT